MQGLKTQSVLALDQEISIVYVKPIIIYIYISVLTMHFFDYSSYPALPLALVIAKEYPGPYSSLG